MPSAASPAPTPPSSRERLIAAMGDALQRRGLHGVGLAEVLAAAGAPKGVLYHHFPGGKTALAVAAVEAAVARVLASLDRVLRESPDPVAAVERWLAGSERHLRTTAFARGCPLATVALESTPEDVELRAALAVGFGAIRGRVAEGLRAAGHARDAADGLAALVVAAYEGGLLQARVAGDVAPMADASRALFAVLRAAHAPAIPPVPPPQSASTTLRGFAMDYRDWARLGAAGPGRGDRAGRSLTANRSTLV